jgi:LPS export ABC transporter protein LptC
MIGMRMMGCMVILALALVSCDNPEQNQPRTVAQIAPDAPAEESRNATLLFTDSNWTRARLQAGYARKFTSRGETLLDSGVFVKFFNPDGSVNATLVADSARIDDRTSDMTAFGSVHVVSETRRTVVDTDRLFYDASERRLHSDDAVTIVDSLNGRILKGTGFESDESLHYTIYNASGRTMQGEEAMSGTGR